MHVVHSSHLKFIISKKKTKSIGNFLFYEIKKNGLIVLWKDDNDISLYFIDR